MQKNIQQIKKIAEDVYNKLGSGFNERVYENAMKVGLRHAKIPYEAQKVVELTYKDHYVGEGYADIIVRIGKEKIILELKSVGKVGGNEIVQLKNYLKRLSIKKGILVNFQSPSSDLKKNPNSSFRKLNYSSQKTVKKDLFLQCLLNGVQFKII